MVRAELSSLSRRRFDAPQCCCSSAALLRTGALRSLPTQGWEEEGGVGLLRPGNPSPATVATKGAAAALG